MPTRTPETEQNYRERAARTAETEKNKAGRRLSPVELVTSVMQRNLQPSSIRQMRTALMFTMDEAAAIKPEYAAALNAAITLLGTWGAQAQGTVGLPQTSQHKQKEDVERDLWRVCKAVLATDSEHAKPLVAALNSGALTGLRFVEWPTAKFRPSTVPGYAWELLVANGKSSNDRGHGPERTLRWAFLPDYLVALMKYWIAVAKGAKAQGRYDTLNDSMESLMRRVTRQLFPRRHKRPTLSSVRHAATARFKGAYVATATTEEEKQLGRARVAALLGHGSDATASTHYARAESGTNHYPVPVPDPIEVARIRRRFVAPKHRGDPEPDVDGSDET
ncbi:hypothetical protein [Bradyrhizobium guangzhouense]|uniref:hypothetical protein n=1 Tax=Bradyrhizobium guangzhouense TaxID=1325095 RepID=UPI001009ABCA|nr:hypothetical protein [Bradyrhizobium guangzhouense]RXH10133.1 hypothetical protein EAS54_32305 [Bradyrhizobium guangzhouense]